MIWPLFHLCTDESFLLYRDNSTCHEWPWRSLPGLLSHLFPMGMILSPFSIQFSSKHITLWNHVVDLCDYLLIFLLVFHGDRKLNWICIMINSYYLTCNIIWHSECQRVSKQVSWGLMSYYSLLIDQNCLCPLATQSQINYYSRNSTLNLLSYISSCLPLFVSSLSSIMVT